ncbi:hypothetical protein [Streptacidiphilus sp. MAP12-20]|uniref:hypothetical protein n=1 Tax=Streptacidiphilus sp. MAP12-20 TaxID=3156299 RepID=UPI003512214D
MIVLPLLGSLIDPFTAGALNTAVWTATSSGGLVTLATPGRVAVQATAAYPALGAAGPYEATGQALYARVTPALAGTGGGAVQTTMRVQQDPNNYAALVCTPGTSWQAVVYNAGVATTVPLPTFDPAQHAWWQLTERAGQWLFSVSADGAAWTQLAAIAYTWSPHAVLAYFIAGSSTVSGQSAYVEHVNTPLGTSSVMPSWPKIRFQVAFNQGANTGGQPSFVDLSWRLRGSWSATPSGRQYELDQVQSGQMTCTLWNLDGALDALNTGSAYSPNVLPMRPCRLQAVWPPTRNLVPQAMSNGTAPPSAWYAYNGTVAAATGLAPAPTGHTTATAWQFPITGSLANQYPILTGVTGGSADPTAFPVVAGQSYTWSGWASRSAGGDASLGITQNILWYDQTGAQITVSGGSLPSVPVSPAWAQNVVTGTAPATAVSARIGTWLTNAATTAVNTIYLTGMQFEQAATATPWTAGGVVYPLWAGYVERWPQQWDYSGTYGMADLTCIDALAGLAQFTLQPNFAASLTALKPTFVFPLNEAAGATQFHDLLGANPHRLTYSPPALGAGGGTISAGNSVQGAGSVGSSGPVITLTNPNWGINGTTKAGVLLAAQPGKNLPPTQRRLHPGDLLPHHECPGHRRRDVPVGRDRPRRLRRGRLPGLDWDLHRCGPAPVRHRAGPHRRLRGNRACAGHRELRRELAHRRRPTLRRREDVHRRQRRPRLPGDDCRELHAVGLQRGHDRGTGQPLRELLAAVLPR